MPFSHSPKQAPYSPSWNSGSITRVGVCDEPVFVDRHFPYTRIHHSKEYGVPVNQLSLIYLVKEQPVVKTRHQIPLAQNLVSNLVAESDRLKKVVELRGIEPRTS